MQILSTNAHLAPLLRSTARPAQAAVANPAAPAATSADAVSISQAARDLLAAHAPLATLPALLLPNPQNIAALSRDVAAKLPEFLARNHIPSPPSSITYDSEGRIQLPADYADAERFKRALADDPAMENELRTVAALTSHLVEMRKSIPFQQEYAASTSRAQADAVVAKYSALFSGKHHYDVIAIHFSPNGELTLSADGRSVF